MKSKKFLFLVGGVALLVGYAVYDYRSEVATTELKDKQATPMPFAIEAATAIELENQFGKVKLGKTDGKWQLEQPVQDLADQLEVEDWLKELERERLNDEIYAESAGIDWALYGLDLAKAKAKISAGSQSVQLQIGSKKNFEGNSFLRVNENNFVSVGTANWQNLLAKKSVDFRFKRLYRKALSDIYELHIKTGTESIRINRVGDQWVNMADPNMRLDAVKVKNILDLLYNYKAQDYLSEGKPAADQIKILGLSSPKVVLTVKAKDQPDWSMKLAESKDKVATAWTSSPEFLMKIMPNELEAFSVKLDDLRDRKEPFVGAQGQPAKIRIIFNGFANEFVETDGNWKWQNEQPKFTFQKEKLKSLIDKLRGMELTLFTDKAQHPDLRTAQQQVEFLDHEGKGLIKLEIGKSSKVQNQGSTIEVTPARTNSYANVFLLKLTQVNDLALAEIVIPTP
jgi:hypothetical protein